jgi:hypothetical protein
MQASLQSQCPPPPALTKPLLRLVAISQGNHASHKNEVPSGTAANAAMGDADVLQDDSDGIVITG